MNIILFAFLLVLAVNLIAFLVAFKWQTDKLTDITYSLCFFILAIVFWWWNKDFGIVNTLLMLMIAAWSIRLGAYLLLRIKKIGVDHRFDEMRPNWKRYIRFWIIQAFSIIIIALPFVIALATPKSGEASIELGGLQLLGVILWFAGWLLQTFADAQKYSFKNQPENKGTFIKSGLFRHIRHPNYLGEIMVWTGIFLYSVPFLHGWNWISIISPLWIITLLIFISGIPLLEKSNEKKYGELESYRNYFKSSWRLIPGLY